MLKNVSIVYLAGACFCFWFFCFLFVCLFVVVNVGRGGLGGGGVVMILVFAVQGTPGMITDICQSLSVLTLNNLSE